MDRPPQKRNDEKKLQRIWSSKRCKKQFKEVLIATNNAAVGGSRLGHRRLGGEEMRLFLIQTGGKGWGPGVRRAALHDIFFLIVVISQA